MSIWVIMLCLINELRGESLLHDKIRALYWSNSCNLALRLWVRIGLEVIVSCSHLSFDCSLVSLRMCTSIVRSPSIQDLPRSLNQNIFGLSYFSRSRQPQLVYFIKWSCLFHWVLSRRGLDVILTALGRAL